MAGPFDNLDPVGGLGVADDPFADIKIEKPSEFTKGLKRGGYGVVSTGARSAEAASKELGLDRIAGWFDQQANAAEEQRKAERLRPRVGNIEQIEGAGDIPAYLASLTGEQLPNIGATIAGVAAGRAIGGRVAAGATAPLIGGTAGGFATSYAQNFGDLLNEQKEIGISDPALAAKAAVPIAALDAIGPGLAVDLIKGVGKTAVKKGLTEAVKKILVGFGVGALGEGTTEGTQELLSIEARNKLQPGYANTPEATSRIANAVVGGGALGGIFGGVGGGVSQAIAPAEPAAPVVEPVREAAPLRPAPEQPAPPTATPEEMAQALKPELLALPAPTGVREPRLLPVPFEPKLRSSYETVVSQLDQEGQNAARKGSFTQGHLLEHLGTDALGAPAETGGGNRDGQGRKGEAEGQARVEELRRGTLQARVDELDRKRRAGMLMSASEIKELRQGRTEMEVAGTPQIEVPAVSKGREARRIVGQFRDVVNESTFKQGVSDALAITIADLNKGLPTPAIKPDTAQSILTKLTKGAEEALSSSNTQTAVDTLRSAFQSAMKGKVANVDLEGMTNEFIDRLNRIPGAVKETRQGTLFSKAALDPNTVVFSHWGTVPHGGMTNPNLMGTGVAGRDQAVNREMGIPYTSAVVRGAEYREPAVQARPKMYGMLKADKVYTVPATGARSDPRFVAAAQKVMDKYGPSFEHAMAQYMKDIRDEGFDAIRFGDQLRIFTPQQVFREEESKAFSGAAVRPVKFDAKAVIEAHNKGGGSSTNIVTGESFGGVRGYAVSTFKGRELVIPGKLTPEQVTEYAAANADILTSVPGAVLGTWYNPEDGNNYLDVSQIEDTLGGALRLARENDQLAIFDMRAGVTIPLGHPVFDSAIKYNAAAGMPPPMEVDYAEIDADRMRKIARVYETLEPVSNRPEVVEAYKALVTEVEAQFQAAVGEGIVIEPWRQEGQPYANSAEMRADLFDNKHIYVFEGGEPHPYMTPEQNWKFRAVHDIYGHAKTGFEFGARGEMNATRAHAQMFTERAVPALVTETIGQNSWVNFSAANAGLAPEQRAYAQQKADLLPEDLWRPILEEGSMKQKAYYHNVQDFIAKRGRAALEEIQRMIGGRDDVVVEVFMSDASRPYAGRYSAGEMKDLLSFAANAEDVRSVARHEGFHFIENRVLSAGERAIIARELTPGSKTHTELLRLATEYDKNNKTETALEIVSNPREASAYAYENWASGKLTPSGALARVFKKIMDFAKRLHNWMGGNGFRTMEDIFEAIDAGVYAQKREAKMKVLGVPTDEWYNAVEPDILPGAQGTFYKNGKLGRDAPSSQAAGRPHWVQSGADVAALRKLLKELTLEGERGRKWHERSAKALSAFVGNDIAEVEKLAALVANYSPRNLVGMDLRAAITAYVQYKKGDKIFAGGFTQGKQNEVAEAIMSGADVSGIKRGSFFKNMMIYLAPEKYPEAAQFATVDMWIAHIFGYGRKDGRISKGEYLYADAEVKRLAQQLGWPVYEVQAAMWIAIKARMNAVRRQADAIAEEKKWFEYMPDPKNPKKKLRKVKDKYETDYVMMWRQMGLNHNVSSEELDGANYAYDTAMIDIAEGRITMTDFASARITDEDLAPWTENFNTAYSEASKLGMQASLFSRAATIEMEDAMRRGEFDKGAWMRHIGNVLDGADLPEPNRVRALGLIGKHGKGIVSQFIDEHFHSGEALARKSAGYQNVHNVLTYFDQYKKRLISNAVDQQLAGWREAGNTEITNVSRALLKRTMEGYVKGSDEYVALTRSLSENERVLFDEAEKMIANQLRAEFDADKKSYARILGPESPEFREWHDTRQVQVEHLIETGYFPERRYGDHAVNIYVVDPATNRKVTIGFELYETKTQAKLRIDGGRGVQGLKELLAPYAEIGIEYGYRYKPEIDASVSFQRVMEVLDTQNIKLTQSEKERLAKAMIAADSSRRNRIFRRENIPGASIDGLRVLSEFAINMANKVAYAEFGDPIQKAKRGDRVTASFDVGGQPMVQVNPEINMWDGDNPELVGFYRQLAEKRASYVLKPQDAKLAAGARTLATLQFLGGSIAAMGVQFLSLPMNTVPWMIQHTGMADANAKVYGGFKTAVQNIGILGDLTRLQNRANPIPGVDEIPGLRDALIVAFQDGTTMDTDIYEIMGLARGQIASLPRGVQKAMNLWMAPFRKAEQINRWSTFIAAYKIAATKGLSGQQQYEFAQKAVYSTQFRYDEVNRPSIATTPIGSVLMTFKTYPIYVLELLTNLAKTDKKAAAVMLTTLWFFAGVEGFPFAEDIEDLIDTIAHRIFRTPFNSKRAIRNMAAEYLDFMPGVDEGRLLFTGGANFWWGMNIAGRVGIGNMIPGSRAFTADADMKKVVEEIGGPAYSAVTGWGKAFDPMSKMELEESLRALPILAVQNAAKGAYAFDRGYFTDQGGRKLEAASGWNAITQAIGFSSDAVRHAYDLDRMDRTDAAYYKAMKDDYTNEIIRGMSDGDQTRVHEAFEAVKAWNARHPEMLIAIDGASIRRAVALAGLSLNERTMRMLPRPLRANSLAHQVYRQDEVE